MILLEIAAQGVRGLAPAGGRLVLKAGYNVVSTEGAALRRLVEALLHPDPRDGETLPRTSAAPGAAAARGGLTLVGDDGVTYRLVRDFATGCQLHRFDPERRAFAPVSQDLSDIAAFLGGSPGVPSPGRLSGLLSLAAADLPSRQPGAGLRGGAAMPPSAPATPEEARRRLAALRVELERSRVAEKLQYRLDGLQSRLFKLEEALKAGEKIREGLAAAEGALAALGPAAQALDGLGDVDAKLAAFEKAAARREESLARLEGELQAMADRAGGPVAPWRDPQFLAAVAAGLAALAAGVAGAATGQTGLRTLALLDVPAFGWAGWVALRWVGQLESSERVGRRRRLAGDRERKIEEVCQRDTAEVKAVLKALGMESLGDLREAAGRLADARSVTAEWRRRLGEWETRRENRDAAAEKERALEEIAEVERQLADQAGGYVRDPRSVEMEMARVEAEQGAPPASAPASAAAEPIQGALERAAAELGVTPAAVARAVQPRVGQLLPVVSGHRFNGCAVDERGNVTVHGGGRGVPSVSLAAADRDLIFLALKLGLLELALTRARTVALLDDAFAALPDGARRAVAALLKQLGRSGQIVHCSSDPVFRQAADHLAA